MTENAPVSVPDWTPRPAPALQARSGRFIDLERFDADRHAEALFEAIGGPEHDDLWEFIPVGPLASAEALAALFTVTNADDQWLTYVARRPGEARLLGTASLMAVRAAHGVAEVGCVIYGPELKRTAAATELQYLLAAYAFDDLGYRRYEWKCDARNTASRSAAERLGFVFEGIHRQHMVVRGLNRDTAWFSITDGEWPAVRAAFEQWLDPASFDAAGKPKRSLAELRAALG